MSARVGAPGTVLEHALNTLKKDGGRNAALDEARKMLQNAQRDEGALQGLLRDGMHELEAVVAECVGVGADTQRRPTPADARLLEQAVGVMVRAADAAGAAAAVGRLPGGAIAAHSQAQLDHLQGALLHVVFAGAAPPELTNGRDTDGGREPATKCYPLEGAYSPSGGDGAPQSLAALAARCAGALRALADAATASAPAAPPPRPPSRGGAPEPPPRISDDAAAAAEGAETGEVERWLAKALTVKTTVPRPAAAEAAAARSPQRSGGGPRGSGNGGSAMRVSAGAASQLRSERDGGISGASGRSSRSVSARRVTFDATAPLSDEEEEDDADSGCSRPAAGTTATATAAAAAPQSPLEAALFADGGGGTPEQGTTGTRSEAPRRTSSSSRRCAAELLRSGAGSRASRGSHGELVLSPSGKEMAPAGIAKHQLSGSGVERGASSEALPWERDAFDRRDDGLTEGLTADEAAELQRAALTAAWLRNCGPLAAAALPCAAAAATAAAADAAARAATAAAEAEDPLQLQLHLLRSISPGAASPNRRSAALGRHHLQQQGHEQQSTNGGVASSAGGVNATDAAASAPSPPRGPWGSSAGGATAASICPTSLTSTLASTGAASSSPGSPRRRGARYCRAQVSCGSGAGGAGMDGPARQQARAMAASAAAVMGPDSRTFMDAAAQLMEALAALGRDERFHPAILEATHRGAELAALLGLTSDCPALEEPLVRLVAALACLGDDATRHALIDTGAVDILIHQLLHRVSGAAAPTSDHTPPASGPCPLLGPCVSVCLGALASLALVSNCAKQLMVARRLPQFLSRVIAAAEAAAVAANAAGELPPAGAAAADLLAVLQEGTVASGLFPSGSPPHEHAMASAGGCNAVSTGPAHICVAPHPRVAAAAAAAAEAASPRTPHSTPVAAAAPDTAGVPAGPFAGSPSPLRRVVASSSGGGSGSFGGDAPRNSWGNGVGAFFAPDPAAIERGVAELVTRVRAATLSDPRTQAPRHALDEKLSGSRWAALSSLALAGGGGNCMGGRAPATNISIVPGGALGGGAAAEPGATPFNSPALRGGALGATSPAGGASPCASLTSTMRAGGTGPAPSMHSTLKSSGALVAALGGATPFNSPMRASEGGGAFIGAGGSTLQRLLAAQQQQQQQQQQQRAVGGGMASAFSTLSHATPANSPAAGLHSSGRYGAPPCSGSAIFGGASPLTTLTRSGSPGRGMHGTGTTLPSIAAAAVAAPRMEAPPHGAVWGSDCGALNVATAEDTAAAALRRSVAGGSLGGAGPPVRTSNPAPASFLQPMHAERQSLAGAACNSALPHIDSLVCPSLLSPYGGAGTGVQPQQEGRASGAGASAGGAPSPCGRCGRLMSNCCHCSAAGAVPGDAVLGPTVATGLRSAGLSAGGAVEVSRALFNDATGAAATPASSSSRRLFAAAAEAEGEAPRGGYPPAPFESAAVAGAAAAAAAASAAAPAAGGAAWNWLEQLQDGASTGEGDGAAGAVQEEGLEEGDPAYPPIQELSAALRFSQRLQESNTSSARRASAHSARQQVPEARAPSTSVLASEAGAAAAASAWALPGGDYDLSGASDLQDLAARLEAVGSGAEEAAPLQQQTQSAGTTAAKGIVGGNGGSFRRQVGQPAEDSGPYELEENEWAEGEEAAAEEAEYPTVFI